jgi:glutamine synthetase
MEDIGTRKSKARAWKDYENPDALRRFTLFMFTNYKGELKWMEESTDNTEDILSAGVGIDGSSVGLASHDKSDVLLMPDVETGRKFNMEDEDIYSFFCQVKTWDEEHHPMDPRTILARVIEKGRKLKYMVEMFSELEFYITTDAGEPIDKGSYLESGEHDKSLKFRRELCHLYESAGIRVKRLHHECGPGQNEIELQLQEVMRNCDNTILGWYLMEALARKYTWRVNKFPKPWPELAGSGLHQHILLRHLDGTNAMLGEGLSISGIGRKFIAGLIKYSADIVAVFATSIETFQRLKPGFEAPVYSYWGKASRNALIRIPSVGMATREKVRCEFRAGDASGSPHLMCAMIYAAGLKGIEDDLECPPSWEDTVGNLIAGGPELLKKHGAQVLPHTHAECAQILKDSPFIKEVLPELMINKLIEIQLSLKEIEEKK